MYTRPVTSSQAIEFTLQFLPKAQVPGSQTKRFGDRLRGGMFVRYFEQRSDVIRAERYCSASDCAMLSIRRVTDLL